VRSLLGSILLKFVKIVKFVGCSKLILNLIKFNKHLYMTINVIEVFFFKIVKLQFILHSTSIDC
jgi:hypothetical protein